MRTARLIGAVIGTIIFELSPSVIVIAADLFPGETGLSDTLKTIESPEATEKDEGGRMKDEYVKSGSPVIAMDLIGNESQPML